ncbi:MAG: helicase [Myxococcales bacterium]|nr:helicase [Myxococcales bacterium]
MSSTTLQLGPTNTGKTHRAILRMLEHPSGMMGLPLRLLAREVYDKVSAERGEGRVALVTGEEKRVPKGARYFIATVEAMPTDRSVDFVAIDEVQLASNRERGHVFTERLLHARGRAETWFLGSPAMQPLLLDLVPDAKIAKSPRLSTLKHAGPSSLGALPRRSAVVAFSASRVYEIADRLREKKGGAAVVLGALSPRARNAQVAMYQAGEVDHVVATDAIGMGLNLDLVHVAFADLRKFDGRESRDLEISELSQIAGRAGRYVRDGTFGTLSPCPPLGDGAARALESHALPRIDRVFWRSADLDFTSVDALLGSLRVGAPSPRLRRVEPADDERALAALLERTDIAARATSRDQIQLLWEVCAVPDYKKLLFEDHLETLATLYRQLTGPRGRIDADWAERELARIERGGDDVDTLVHRLAEIRLWSYAANQERWLDDKARFSERARDIEDRISDKLHQLLVARFVAVKRRSASGAAPPAPPSSPFAKLAALREQLPTTEPAVSSTGPQVERIIEAEHHRFSVDASGAVSCDGFTVGRLKPGRSVELPEVAVTLDVEPGARLRLARRLVAFARDLGSDLGGFLRDLEGLSPAGRGVAHLIARGLGSAAAGAATEQLAALTDEDRAAFAAAGVVLGRAALYVPKLLKPDVVAKRVAFAACTLAGASTPGTPRPAVRWPTGREVSIPASPAVLPELYAAVGYLPLGPLAVRADILERIVGRIARAEEPPDAGAVAGWLSCSRPAAERALERLAQLAA